MAKYQENRLFILNDRQSLRINTELAMEIGLNESIVLLQMEYLISISENVMDGRKWVYNSAQEWKDQYLGFWSIETIRRIINSLISKGYLIEGNYNKKKYDKTKWFALNFEMLKELKSIRIGSGVEHCSQSGERSSQSGERCGQNKEPIPKTTAKTTTEKKSIYHSNASVAEKISSLSSAEDSLAEGEKKDNEVNEVIKMFQLVNPSGYQDFFKNKTQRNSALKLKEKLSVKSIKECLNLLSLSNKCWRKQSDIPEFRFTPQVISPHQLFQKLENVKSHFFRISQALEKKYGHGKEDLIKMLEFELRELSR